MPYSLVCSSLGCGGDCVPGEMRVALRLLSGELAFWGGTNRVLSAVSSGLLTGREGITRVLSAPTELSAAGRALFIRVLSALTASRALVFSVTAALSAAVDFLTGMKRVLSSISAVDTAGDLIFVLSLSPGLFILIRPRPCFNSVPYRRMKLFLGCLAQ